MQRYVVGIAFALDLRTVLLIEKRRPTWQAGRWNGVGGKVEPGEDFPAAMEREFREETGLLVPQERWRHVLTYQGTHGSGYEVRFFTSATDDVFEAKSLTDEPVGLHYLGSLTEIPVIGNLRWIVPLCLDREIEEAVVVHGR